MNSIEKFVDRLMHTGNSEKKTEDEKLTSTISTLPSRAGIESITAKSNVAMIDLDRLAAAGMVVSTNTRSLIAEEFRTIKRPLLKNAFNAGAHPADRANLIMVTSALPGEGKSFSSINLAMSISMELDHTVLLVEADVAKPAIARYLGWTRNEKGLVDYLADGPLNLEELIVRTSVPKLSVLCAGRNHSHSAELLASQGMRRLAEELAQRYPDRVVIFDSPPLLVSNEAVVLSTLVGQVVMVVESGKTPQQVVKDALSLLGPSKTIGVILNKSLGGKSLGYGYGYAPE